MLASLKRGCCRPFAAPGLLWRVKANVAEPDSLPPRVTLYQFEVKAYLTLRVNPVLGFFLVLITTVSSVLTFWHVVCASPFEQSRQTCVTVWWIPPFLRFDMASWGVVLTLFLITCLLLLKFGKFFRLTSFNLYFTNDVTLSRRIAGANRHRNYVMVTRDRKRLEYVAEDWKRADRLKGHLNERKRVISIAGSDLKAGMERRHAPLGLEQLIRYSLMQEPAHGGEFAGDQTHEDESYVDESRSSSNAKSSAVINLKLKTLALYRTPLRLYFALVFSVIAFVSMSHFRLLGDTTFPKISLSAMALVIAASAVAFHLQAIGRTFTAWLSTPTMQPFRAFEERWVRSEFIADSETAPAWAEVSTLESWRFGKALVKIAPAQELLHIGLFLSVETFLHLVHILKW